MDSRPAFRSSCDTGTIQPTAADIGAITHALLERIDRSRACVRGDLEAQLSELVDRKLLDASLASRIDLDAIAWFMAEQLGQLLRRHAKIARRELPINFPAPPELFGLPASSDPLDCVMIRGRIDVLLPLRDGAVIIDYKTDHVDDKMLEARLEHYRAQLCAYRDAIAKLLEKPVRTAYLVFLSPRLIKEV
jgi:ATP-dependent helicase/nuclease subunit A